MVRCARVKRVEHGVYVDQPSPGHLIESQNIDLLETWDDCFQMQPKRRMLVREAR